jgi:hypothetical protein
VSTGRGRVRAGKAGDRYRGTIAAAIVAQLNYGGARLMGGFGDSAGFYQAVAKFVKGRRGSAGLMRAGFFAGYDLIHGRAKGSAPRYKHAPGSAAEKILAESASIVFENFASSKAAFSIADYQPSAFEVAAQEVEKMMNRWVMEDFRQGARAAGLNPS